MIWLNVLVVVALVLVEALFVAAEMALVSLRESQVRGLEERSRRGRHVKHLLEDPNRFLSAVQIGVTLTALLSSAFGAITLANSAAHGIQDAGLSHTPAKVLGFIGVTLVITYVTLVVGELAPKRIALQRNENAALLFAPFLDRIALFSRPVIWLLSHSTNAIVRLLGGKPEISRQAITETELRDLVAAQESLTSDERRLIDEVFAAGERQLREVMVPRTEVDFLDESLSITTAARKMTESTHSRFPVVRGSQDDVVGFVHVRDLLAPGQRRRGGKVGDVARKIPRFPDSKNVLEALSEMRAQGQHLAVVIDEYGGTAGIVTLEDLIEELVGEIRDEYDPRTPESRKLRNGEVDVDGLLNIEDFEDVTGVRLPEGPYETVAGYIVRTLGHIPSVGEIVMAPGAQLKVAKLDGRRVARVRVNVLPEPAGENG